MTNLKMIKCPHCQHEFGIDVKREIDSGRITVFRFGGVSKPVGPKPKYITVRCKNKECGRAFKIKTAGL